MKTRVFFLTVVAALFTTMGYATKIPTMNVISVDSEKALVTFEPGTVRSFGLTINDERGVILYYKKTNGPVEDFRKVFDFSDLKNGNYSLKIDYNNCCIQREMFVTKGKLKIGREIRLYRPCYKFENDKLYISFLNPSLGNVYLDVYESGKFVDRKKLGENIAIQKCVDLSRLKGNHYQFILSDSYGRYSFAMQ